MKKFAVPMLIVLALATVLGACAPEEREAIEPEVVEVEKIVEVEKEAELKDVTIGFSWNRKDSQLMEAWEDYMEQYAA